MLSIKNLTTGYGKKEIIHDVTFTVGEGEFLGVIGPNGSGKTTLLKCINHIIKPFSGTVQLDGNNLQELERKHIAKIVGVVPQITNIQYDFTVQQIIMMGRYSHQDGFYESEKDKKIVEKSMILTNITHLKNRFVTELSGGEFQKVMIARALSQKPRILLFDEPTAHLDISGQYNILQLTKRLKNEEKLSVVSVFHDLNLASQFSDKILMLDKGKIVQIGKPIDVLTENNIKKVYNIYSKIETHPITKRLQITYLPDITIKEKLSL